MIRKNLTADNTSKNCTVIKSYRNTKVDKPCMTGINTMAFTVTFFTSSFTFSTSSCQLNTEIGEIVAVTYILAVISDCNHARLTSILDNCGARYTLFTVEEGEITEERREA